MSANVERVIAGALRSDTSLCYPDGAPVDWERIGKALAAALRAANLLREPGLPDAATAAVERVRAVCLHLGGVDGDVSQPAPSYYVSVGRNVVATEVLAALDGAPEFEWEERLAACDKHGTHCWSCTRHTERRRPAGEWHRLPVDGEKP